MSKLVVRHRAGPLALTTLLIVTVCSSSAEGQPGISSLVTGQPADTGLIGNALTGLDLLSMHRHRAASILLAGGVLAWFSWNLEDPERIRRVLDQPAFDMADVGDIYGEGLVLGTGTLALVALGRVGPSPAILNMGKDLSQSLVLSGAAVWTLKLGINRRRPNGAKYSFPSGHTAAAFAVAPVVAHHLGTRAAMPAYAMAGLTAIARMEGSRHYLSDVLFGAAIGLAVGDAVVGGGSLSGVLNRLRVSPNRIGLSFGL